MHNDWKTLLSTARLGRSEPNGYEDLVRSAFDRDYDRIVFSSAFRRLQDKTQVFPLSRNDFTRTRLTHSMEVACVGRSLGQHAGKFLRDARLELPSIDSLGTIVAAACLAHDIGNPPFGHSGESAIQEWAKKNIRDDRYNLANEAEKQDICQFEGNAQGIRVLTRLQDYRRQGGLQLTLATVGAMMKYPCGSVINPGPRNVKRIEQKKFGYLNDDGPTIIDALRRLGMKEYATGAFYRHPLAFLVEAADDICYAIIDLEDSVDQNLISADEASDILEPVARKIGSYERKKYQGKSKLRRLRGYAIHALTNECARVFCANVDPILAGHAGASLIDMSSYSKEYDNIKAAVQRVAYSDRRVLAIEVAGYKVIGGLLDIFVPALCDPERQYHSKVLGLFPASYLGAGDDRNASRDALDKLSPYQRIIAVTDFIAGMTDSFAVNLYQNLSGIELHI